MEDKDIEIILKEIGKQMNKKKITGEICICGGAAVAILGGRKSTSDIDCVHTLDKEFIKKIIYSLGYSNLEIINSDFQNSDSYFPEFIKKCNFHKEYGNKKLKVYVSTLEVMISMKLVAFRMRQDISDLEFLIKKYEENKNTKISSSKIYEFLTHTYGKDYNKKLSDLAIEYIKNINNIFY